MIQENLKILIVDDEPSICSTLESVFKDEGYLVASVQNGEDALKEIKEKFPDLVLLDIWMPGLDGIETLKRIKQTFPRLPVIMMSGHASLQTAIDALKIGAVDFIEKPIELAKLLNSVANSITDNRLNLNNSNINNHNLKKDNQTPSDSKDIQLDSSSAENVNKELKNNNSVKINTEPFQREIFWKGNANKQRTLKSSAVLYGQGLHSGRKSGLMLEPLPENSGIHFAGVGEPSAVPAHLDFVDSTGFATTIKLDSKINPQATKAGTIEHLMSALAVFGITNLLVKCDGEVPVMDGSSREFCELFKNVGIVEQESHNYEIKVPTLTRYEKNSNEWIQIEPQDFLSIEYFLSYPKPVGDQKYYIEFKGNQSQNIQTYETEIAPARTFGFMKDIGFLQKQGLALGGRFDNCILIGEDGPLNTNLRFQDEFARHKILDMLGDLYLLGRPLCGKITASMTGHSDNVELLKKIMEKNMERRVVLGG